jgi:hypothetical protein
MTKSELPAEADLALVERAGKRALVAQDAVTQGGGARGYASTLTAASRSELSSMSGVHASVTAAAASADGRRAGISGAGTNGSGRSAYGERSAAGDAKPLWPVLEPEPDDPPGEAAPSVNSGWARAASADSGWARAASADRRAFSCGLLVYPRSCGRLARARAVLRPPCLRGATASATFPPAPSCAAAQAQWAASPPTMSSA